MRPSRSFDTDTELHSATGPREGCVGAGAAFWLLWSAVTPGVVGPRAAVTPFLCAVMGVFWASTLAACAAHAKPSGPLARLAEVPVRMRLGRYGAVLAGGAAQWCTE